MIHGDVKVVSIDWLKPRLTGIFNLNSPRIGKREYFLVLSLKIGILFYFKSDAPLIITTCKS